MISKKISSGLIWVGEWLYDPEKSTLSKDGKSVRIEPIMAKTLDLLVNNPNQTISKETLRQQVWQQEFVSDESVARCISRLRKTLGDNPQAPTYIQTLPKKGYSLIAPLKNYTLPSAHKKIYWIAGVLVCLGLGRLVFRQFAETGTTRSYVSETKEITHAEADIQRAEYFIRQKTPPGMRKSHDYLKAALRQVPNHPKALALLGLIYSYNHGYHFKTPYAERLKKSAYYTQKAFEQAPNHAIVQVARGSYAFYFENDYAKASAALKKSIELDQGSSWGHHLYALVLATQQKFSESIYRIKQANKIDATSEGILWDKVWIYYLAQQNKQALTSLKEARNFSATSHGWIEMLVYHQASDHLTATRLWIKRNLKVGYSQTEMQPAILAVNKGNWRKAYQHFISLNTTKRNEPEDPEALAIWCMLTGNLSEARQYLAQSRKIPHRVLEKWLDIVPIFLPITQDKQIN